MMFIDNIIKNVVCADFYIYIFNTHFQFILLIQNVFIICEMVINVLLDILSDKLTAINNIIVINKTIHKI